MHAPGRRTDVLNPALHKSAAHDGAERAHAEPLARRHDTVWTATALAILAYALVLAALPNWDLFAVGATKGVLGATLMLGWVLCLLVLAVAWHLGQPCRRGARPMRTWVLGFVPGLAGIGAASAVWHYERLNTPMQAGEWMFVGSLAALLGLTALWHGGDRYTGPAGAEGIHSASWKQFARDWSTLVKPGLNGLVLMTAFIGYWMASGDAMNWTRCAWAMLGTALTAFGGAALNQYAERDLDGLMKRTAGRPLPARRMQPGQVAVGGVALSIVGLAALALEVNVLTAFLGASSLAVYLYLYTPLKRIDSLSTLAGAISGAIPPLMGWTAARNAIDPMGQMLFLILFLWQVPHFLAIAWKYREQYAAAGMKMYCRDDLRGRATGAQTALYASVLLVVAALPILLHRVGLIYTLGALCLGAGYLGMSLRFALRPAQRSSRDLFMASIAYHPLLFALLVVDRLL